MVSAQRIYIWYTEPMIVIILSFNVQILFLRSPFLGEQCAYITHFLVLNSGGCKRWSWIQLHLPERNNCLTNVLLSVHGKFTLPTCYYNRVFMPIPLTMGKNNSQMIYKFHKTNGVLRTNKWFILTIWFKHIYCFSIAHTKYVL